MKYSEMRMRAMEAVNFYDKHKGKYTLARVAELKGIPVHFLLKYIEDVKNLKRSRV